MNKHPQPHAETLAEKASASISGLTFIATLVGYGIIVVVFMYSTFASKDEIVYRSKAREVELADIKDRLKTIDSKLDTLILHNKY